MSGRTIQWILMITGIAAVGWIIFISVVPFLFPPKILKEPFFIGDYLIAENPLFSEFISYEGLSEISVRNQQVVGKLSLPSWNVQFSRMGLLNTFQTVKGTIPQTDRDADGFPDEAELWGEDARRFREWFVYIAMQQKMALSPAWKDRDCSGLIRFAMQEALKKHDTTWYRKAQIPPVSFPDIQTFHYPAVPTLGISIYQLKEGFYSFANARNLFLYNVVKVSQSLQKEVKAGDLLFFYHPQDQEYPYHVMIYTGDGFVYHTGASDVDEGAVRLWKTDEYMKASPLTWLPVKENPNFLGFFRLKIVNDSY